MMRDAALRNKAEFRSCGRAVIFTLRQQAVKL